MCYILLLATGIYSAPLGGALIWNLSESSRFLCSSEYSLFTLNLLYHGLSVFQKSKFLKCFSDSDSSTINVDIYNLGILVEVSTLIRMCMEFEFLMKESTK